MKYEDIESLMNEQMESIHRGHSSETKHHVEDMLENQKNQQKQQEDYRKSLITSLNNIKDMGVPIPFDENMTTEELESLLEEVKY